MVNRHKRFMERALELAAQATGWTSPNPLVGAVIVRDDQIVGEGYHHRPGAPHAEIEALRAAGEAAQDATMYVTLEPCNHHGRTPPCTEAIIAAGITQVFYAVKDPNPIAGGGHQRLVNAGLTVECYLCEDQARHLNRFFFHYVTTGCPYVIAKFAASLDGKIATRTGHSQWITSPEARAKSHTLRQMCDAILVGANTILADNPQLTTRLPQATVSHPLRIVLDSRGRVSSSARLFEPTLPGKTLVVTTEAVAPEHLETLEKLNVEIWMLPATATGQVDLTSLLAELGQRNILSLVVEGGGQVLGSFFDSGLVNEVWAFLAPLIIGGEAATGPIGGLGPATLAEALRLQEVNIEQVGSDFLIRGIV